MVKSVHPMESRMATKTMEDTCGRPRSSGITLGTRVSKNCREIKVPCYVCSSRVQMPETLVCSIVQWCQHVSTSCGVSAYYI